MVRSLRTGLAMRHRRTIAAVLAVYSTVVASGAPLPLAWVASFAPPAVDSDERFPCENCPCGCGTAEHCWRACCCHTLAERLAWARREGVRPPEMALDAAERAGLNVSEWRPAGRYVVRATSVAVEKTPADESLPPCCRKAAACCAAAAEPCCETRPKRKRPTPGVSIVKALACQGLAEAWLALGVATLPASPALVTTTTATYAVESPGPFWRAFDEAPTPPPPERRLLAV